MVYTKNNFISLYDSQHNHNHGVSEYWEQRCNEMSSKYRNFREKTARLKQILAENKAFHSDRVLHRQYSDSIRSESVYETTQAIQRVLSSITNANNAVCTSFKVMHVPSDELKMRYIESSSEIGEGCSKLELITSNHSKVVINLEEPDMIERLKKLIHDKKVLYQVLKQILEVTNKHKYRLETGSQLSLCRTL